MGGYGSTRWHFHSKKDMVEDCRELSIFDFKREGLLKSNSRHSGVWAWKNSISGKVTARIWYEFNTLEAIPFLHLQYTLTHWNGNKSDLDYRIGLETTPCNFGGLRWWFRCPLTKNGRSCGRRVAKLYLPPGGRYYGCRSCYELTYKSSQESDKRVNALKQLGPMAILGMMKNDEIDFIHGLKALPDWIWQR